MTVFTKRAVDIFAPTDAGGNPRQVVNGEVQVWGTEVERLVDLATSGGDLLVYTSLAELNGDLAHDANTAAIVLGDSIDNDGLYMKQGASGAGSWIKVGGVPGQGFVKATNAGAGTANAIQATTPVAVNETQLILLPIVAENTGSPATVAFNGGAALTVKTVSGNDVAAGGLPAGSVMLGVVQGATFRLLSDQTSAAIQAAAEAAQAAAEAAQSGAELARDEAVAAASSVQGTLSSRAYAISSYHPIAAPDFLETAGYLSAGDGGGALYRNNGTSVGDLVITLDDGTTEVGFTIANAVRNVRMHGAVGSNVNDDTAAFQDALSRPGRVIVPPPLVAWKITDTVTFASFVEMLNIGRPTINVESSGNKRGFWMPHGTKNSHVRGDAVINLTVDSAGDDGSYNSAFCLGGPFYVVADPDSCDACSVEGNILVDSVGLANGKPIHVYGHATNWLVAGLTATGRTNFAVSTHWVGNGDLGVLPTKTWHPDLGVIQDISVVAKAGVPLARAYSLSGSGRILLQRCHATGTATLAYNLFVGDYGFTYAQNVGPGQYMQYVLEGCSADDATILFSVDGLSSGLNGSPIWSGFEHGARVHLKGKFNGRAVDSHSGDLSGVSGVATFIADDLDVTETIAATSGDMIKLTAVDYAFVNGKAVVGRGPLVRNCGDVEWRCSLRNKAGLPVAAQYGISVSATSGTTTTTAGQSAGDTELTIDTQNSNVGIGPGTVLRFTVAAVEYEVAVKSYLPPNTAGTITVDPLPAAVGSGVTVTFETCGRSLKVDDCTIDGFAANVRSTGSATAKPRGIRIGRNAKLLRWGNICVDLTAAHDFVDESFQDGGGLAAAGVKFGTALGSNAQRGLVSIYSGANNQRIQYGARAVTGTEDVLFTNGAYMSIDAGASNPAAINIPGGLTNVTQSNNLVASGIATTYP